MASSTAGEASSARSLVVRIVESLVVAPGRDSDAAVISWKTFGHASQTASNQRGGHKAYLEAVDQPALGNGDIVDVLETWEAATEAASGQ
jgi:hypothetical protein